MFKTSFGTKIFIKKGEEGHFIEQKPSYYYCTIILYYPQTNLRKWQILPLCELSFPYQPQASRLKSRKYRKCQFLLFRCFFLQPYFDLPSTRLEGAKPAFACQNAGTENREKAVPSSTKLPRLPFESTYAFLMLSDVYVKYRSLGVRSRLVRTILWTVVDRNPRKLPQKGSKCVFCHHTKFSVTCVTVYNYTRYGGRLKITRLDYESAALTD